MRKNEEQGQALFEMALVIFLFLWILVGIVVFFPRVYVRLAVDTAAYDCATAGVETLSINRGMRQARIAARETIQGYSLLDPSRFTTQVYGTWERAAPVTCRVTYRHGASPIPLAHILFPNASPTTSASVTLLTATFKSDW